MVYGWEWALHHTSAWIQNRFPFFIHMNVTEWGPGKDWRGWQSQNHAITEYLIVVIPPSWPSLNCNSTDQTVACQSSAIAPFCSHTTTYKQLCKLWLANLIRCRNPKESMHNNIWCCFNGELHLLQFTVYDVQSQKHLLWFHPHSYGSTIQFDDVVLNNIF